MIYLMTKPYYDHTVKRELIEDPTLRKLVTLITYDKLFKKRVLRGGTYIFADLERLDREDTEKAAIVWRALKEHAEVRILNDPIRSMRRYELLRNLKDRCINSFNVYRLTDPVESKRYPVFVRAEDEHRGSATPLLHSAGELEEAKEMLARRGESRENKIVVEFCDVSDGSGIYHWYSAHRIGDRILPASLLFSRQWMSKDPGDVLRDETYRAANREYLENNPHANELMQIFEMANIQYGRADYAVLGGRIEVFEINTNPIAPPAEKLSPAFAAIDVQSHAQIPVKLPKRIVTPTVGALQAKGELRIKSVLAGLRLIRFEHQIYALGRPLKKLYRRIRQLLS